MAQDSQDRLIVMLEARVTEFEKRMNRADRTMRTRMRNVESHAERMRKRVDHALSRVGTGAFRALALGAASALAPILSVGAALRTAHSALSDFDNLGNKAQMFGVDVEALQEMRYAAEQGGMAVDNFDTALRRFIRRSAEAAQGTGAAKGAFKELGIELQDASGQMKSSEALLREVADAMQRVPNQADKLRLAFQMFDTDGAAMVNVLAKGSDGLDEFARQARDLGLVIDREMVARTQEMKKELDTATTAMNSHFQQALVNLAPLLVDMAQFAANVAGGIRMITDAVKELMKEGPGAGFGGNQPWSELLTPEQMNAMRLRLRLGNKPGENLYEGFNFGADGNMVLAPPALPPGDDTGTTTRNEAAKAALKQAETVARIVENLKHEQAQLGRTAEQQELYNLLKAAGVELESEYGQAIAAALEPLQAQRAAIEANAEAMALLEDTARTALDAIVDGFLDGKDAGEVFANVLKDIGRQLINIGISGLTRSIGGGFGLPGFDTGGYTGPGGKHQPAGIVHKGEYVFSKEATQRAGVSNLEAMHRSLKGYANGGLVGGLTLPALPRAAHDNGVSVPVNVTIDATGADMAVVGRIQQSVDQLKAELPNRIRTVVQRRQKEMW